MLFPSNCRLCGCNGCIGSQWYRNTQLNPVFHQLFAVVVIVVAIVATESIEVDDITHMLSSDCAVEAPKVAVVSIRLLQLQQRLPWFQNT